MAWLGVYNWEHIKRLIYMDMGYISIFGQIKCYATLIFRCEGFLGFFLVFENICHKISETLYLYRKIHWRNCDDKGFIVNQISIFSLL